MAIHRPAEGSEPLRFDPVERVERRLSVSGLLAVGTLACPECDAPVVPDRPLSPSDWMGCGYCGHPGAVRDFLSLDPPVRPTRVEVRVVQRHRVEIRR